jgi:hypothetical protein
MVRDAGIGPLLTMRRVTWREEMISSPLAKPSS